VTRLSHAARLSRQSCAGPARTGVEALLRNRRPDGDRGGTTAPGTVPNTGIHADGMRSRRAILVFTALLLAAGAVVTAVWFRSTDAAVATGAGYRQIIGALATVCVLTAGNLAVRWLRWYYLCRRLGAFVPTKDSVKIYFGTLPAIATPFYVGELSRAFLVGPRGSRERRIAVFVWLVERCADAVVLGLFLLAAIGQWAIFGIVLALFVLPFLFVGRIVSNPTVALFFRPASLIWIAGSTAAAWLLPILALSLTIARFSGISDFGLATEAFTVGSLLGGLTGIPLGIGLAGSAAITVLAEGGVAAVTLPLTMLVFRAGTVWFALGVGFAALAVFGPRLLALLRRREHDGDHFDDIAAGYADEIDDHMRDRLLARKVSVMCDSLAARGVAPGAKGLDVGCGQGWYAAEMASNGFSMSGCDLSVEQVEHALRHGEQRGVELDLRAGSALELPYEDGTFDFAYSINVFHHVGDAKAQLAAFAEVARVLKPGGCFFLQEMNTRNLLFRFYMGYVFPLMCDIDEGTEFWIRPDELPDVAGATWDSDVRYFTFLPDFTPAKVLKRLQRVEARLERSSLRHLSAHYAALLIRNPDRASVAASADPTSNSEQNLG